MFCGPVVALSILLSAVTSSWLGGKTYEMHFYQKSTILNSFCFSSTSLYLWHCCWVRKMKKMAAKITWKGCTCLENLHLSDTGLPSVPRVMATYAQLLWGELISSQWFVGNLNNDNTQRESQRFDGVNIWVEICDCWPCSVTCPTGCHWSCPTALPLHQVPWCPAEASSLFFSKQKQWPGKKPCVHLETATAYQFVWSNYIVAPHISK